MEIESFFPVHISYCFNPKHYSIKDTLIDYCLHLSTQIKSGGINWVSNTTYNTSDGAYDCFEDVKFLDINTYVLDQVKKYSQLLDIDESLDYCSAWFNIYNKYDYQEFHKHPGYKISAIYILDCEPEAESVIYFKNPTDEMFEIKYKNITNKNSQIISHQSLPGKLIIFPSNISHCVSRNKSDKKRISISYNFTSKVWS